MPPRAILFDCDGVLVDSEVVGLEDSAEYLRSHGFDWSPEDLIRRFTGKRDDRFRAELMAGYRDILGRPPTSEESDQLFDGMIRARRANRHKMKPVPGALSAVKTAQKLGLLMAVASSSRQVHLDRKVDLFGFREAFGEHVYSAEHVPRGKPAPDIFLFAAERIGVPPSACLVIEDSPAGVEAGVAAQINTWGFVGGGHCLKDHKEQLLRAGAERVVQDHTALQQELINVMKEHT